MLSTWMSVYRSSMPAERLKNTATITKHNIYWGTPSGRFRHQFTQRTLKAPKGKLLRRFREGEARYDGYLFDYSSIAVACLDLYEATYNTKYIIEAQELMQTVEEKFS